MKRKASTLIKFVKTLGTRNILLSIGVLLSLFVTASTMALGRSESAHDHSGHTYDEQAHQVEQQSEAVTSTTDDATTLGQSDDEPSAQVQSKKDTITSNSKPPASFTGDEHKNHPKPYPGTPTTRQLNVSQAVIRLHIDQTSDIITANGSGATISHVGIDYSKSAPDLGSHLSIKYDGTYMPGFGTTQSFRLRALPSAIPGTYYVRLVTGTETETINSKNPVYYETTVQVVVIP